VVEAAGEGSAGEVDDGTRWAAFARAEHPPDEDGTSLAWGVDRRGGHGGQQGVVLPAAEHPAAGVAAGRSRLLKATLSFGTAPGRSLDGQLRRRSGPYSNTVRIGYARVSGRTQDHQLQLDALAAADCRDIVIETASTRTNRPKLRQALAVLKPGDTLVIYKPDRVARSMKELGV